MVNNQKQPVTDKEADDSLRPIEALEVDIATQFARGIATPEAHADSASKPSPWPKDMTASEIKLVKAIVAYPMKPSSEYPKLAGISPNTFQKAKPSIISRGLICERKLEHGGRGRSSILLEPLPAAIDLVSAENESSVVED